MEEQHFLRAERLRVWLRSHAETAVRICFSFSFSGEKHVRSLPDRKCFGQIRINYHFVFWWFHPGWCGGASAASSEGQQLVDCHPETCSWFVGYWTGDCGMWKSRRSFSGADVYCSESSGSNRSNLEPLKIRWCFSWDRISADGWQNGNKKRMISAGWLWHKQNFAGISRISWLSGKTCRWRHCYEKRVSRGFFAQLMVFCNVSPEGQLKHLMYPHALIQSSTQRANRFV